MKTTPIAVSAALLLVTGCAATTATPSTDYWRHTAGAQVSFETDHRTCVSRTSRVVTPIGAGPANRVDRPLQRWENPAAERPYMDCMRDLGWSPAAR